MIDALVTYVFIHLFGRKLSGFYLVGFTFLHLSLLQLNRMIENYGGWEIEISVIHMMTILKFSSLAFSYEDGAKKDEELRCSYHRKKYYYI